MECIKSIMHSYTAVDEISCDIGSPVTRSLPYTLTNCSSIGTALPSFILIYSAVFAPITRLYLLRTALIICSSSLFPPNLTARLMTIPPRLITEISVVSAPILTTMTPLALLTSTPEPTASATGLLIIIIFLAFILESLISSKNALFSTSVISVGMAI